MKQNKWIDKYNKLKQNKIIIIIIIIIINNWKIGIFYISLNEQIK